MITNTTMRWPCNLVSIDLETTGLDPLRCGIVEIGAVHPDTGRCRIWMVDPRPCDFEVGALRVNGLTRERLGEPRLLVGAALIQLGEWIRGILPEGMSAVIMGRNPAFDWSFLSYGARTTLPRDEAAFFEQTFAHRKLDTHGALMALAIARGWPVSVDRIDDLYRLAGIEPEAKPHRGLTGALHAVHGLEAIVRMIGSAEQA